MLNNEGNPYDSNFFNYIKNAIIELEADYIGEIVKKALDDGVDPVDILSAMRIGMEEVGRRFQDGVCFLSELVMAGITMKEALEVLKPHLSVVKTNSKGRIVIGTILGDLHDLGKDIIKTLLISAGFEVIDLGIDVPPERFVEEALNVGANVIGISTLLSTTVPRTSSVIKILEKRGLRNKVKVIIGGAVVRPWHTEKFGVDAAVNDAMAGLQIIKGWMGNGRKT